MHHENIVEYYMNEHRMNNRGELEYWLITAYYGNNNLAKYLSDITLHWEQLCSMIYSVAKGE